MPLRDFTQLDLMSLAALYRDSVHVLGPSAYDPAQVEAWARLPDNLEEFKIQLANGTTVVAEDDGLICAFGQLYPGNHIALLYCGSQYARQGYGTAVYEHLERVASQSGSRILYTEASRVARRFFESKGFHVVDVEHVIRHEIELERFKMKKLLG